MELHKACACTRDSWLEGNPFENSAITWKHCEDPYDTQCTLMLGTVAASMSHILHNQTCVNNVALQ